MSDGCHLGMLIKLVELRERKLRQTDFEQTDLDVEVIANELARLLTHLIEYHQKDSDHYTDEEEKQAMKILDRYGVTYTSDQEEIEGLYDPLRSALLDETETDQFNFGYRENCVRCGRKLTVEKSKKRGIGPVCLRKVRNVTNDVIDRDQFWNRVEEVRESGEEDE